MVGLTGNEKPIMFNEWLPFKCLFLFTIKNSIIVKCAVYFRCC